MQGRRLLPADVLGTRARSGGASSTTSDINSLKRLWSRPRVRMAAAAALVCLLMLWLPSLTQPLSDPTQLASRRARPFRLNPEAQALADRIIRLNGIPQDPRFRVGASTPQLSSAPAASSTESEELPQPISNQQLLGAAPTSLADRAAPRTTAERDADELWARESSKDDAHMCPLAASQEAGSSTLPRLPLLYEPRAPRALWMPPLSITTDLSHPHSFNIDAATGRSTVRHVFHPPADSEWSPRGWPSSVSVTSKSKSPTQNRDPLGANFAPRTLLHPDFVRAPPLSCPALEQRTQAYWAAWDAQHRSERERRPLNILVWHGTWTRTTDEARYRGGPMGELALFTSTVLAMTSLAARVTFLAAPQSEAMLLQALQEGEGYRKYDVILIDTYSAEVMERAGFLTQPDFLCRLRSLDYWGTPARQNSWKLPSLKQYLVPFACTADGSSPNTLLHMHRYANRPEGEEEAHVWTEEAVKRWQREHMVGQKEGAAGSDTGMLDWVSGALPTWPARDAAAFADAANTHSGDDADSPIASLFGDINSGVSFPRVYAKKFQVLIWGKEAKYFEGLGPLLRALAEVVPLLSIVKEEGVAHFPNVDDLPRTVPEGLPRIRQLGVLDQATLARTVRESALIIGVGDPILSFTPLEALQVGTPWLNPLFLPARSLWMNGDCVVTSQHQYAEALGAPQVWSFDIKQPEKAARTLRTALQWVRDTQERFHGVPPMYPRDLQFDRLAARLNDNFRSDMCKEAGLAPTPASVAGA